MHRAGITANQVTVFAFVIGLCGSYAISLRLYIPGLALIILSRLYDAVDGALARLTTPTDQGGFLDITLDFLFYASVPLAFAWAAPVANGLPAAILLAAFISTGTSFLAFAVLAAKKGLDSTDYPNKSFYFLGGLTEATETLIAFAAMCIWPEHFRWIAVGFASLCFLTAGMRIWYGYKVL